MNSNTTSLSIELNNLNYRDKKLEKVLCAVTLSPIYSCRNV